jgi:membrane associated rhomboid family serine protease
VIAGVAGQGFTERLGYVPERANLLGLVTYIFAHADVWHVAGNMWFLFLCGLSLEDRWGRLPFAIYYLVAGVIAAGVHHLATSNASASLIGASGAVAGAMGAFLVLFATTKIRFVGFLGFRLTSFEAPAYVMLPLWALVEVLYGLASSAAGTAHWAHVGGFGFGVAVAGAFRVFGVDRRLDDAVERAAVLGNDPRVDAARALVAKGEADQAIALLEGLAKEKPDSTHVQEALRQAQRASTSTAAAPVVAAATSPATSPAVAPYFPAPAGTPDGPD